MAMSGSGACVFAEFATGLAAQTAFEQIPGIGKALYKRADCHPHQSIE